MIIKLLAYLAVSMIINALAFFIKSDFIHTFPGADFLAMLVTIMAINTATSSYIVSKLEELSNKAPANKPFDFTETYDQIKLSLKEQVFLVVVSFIVLVARDSAFIKDAMKQDSANAKWYSIGVDILLTLILIVVVSILWDTAKSIFALISKPPKR